MKKKIFTEHQASLHCWWKLGSFVLQQSDSPVVLEGHMSSKSHKKKSSVAENKLLVCHLVIRKFLDDCVKV